MIVKIKDYIYTIIEVDEHDRDLFSDGELILYGLTKHVTQEIKIYKHLSVIRRRETLIHELTHAFCDVYINSFHIKDKFDEEDICCFMATYSEDILKIVNKYLEKEEA